MADENHFMVIENIIPTQDIYFQLGRFAIVLVIGLFITRFVALKIASGMLDRRGSSKKMRSQVKNVLTIVGLFMTLSAALQAGEFGNLVTIIGTIAAALTVAIGFGMRDEVANLVAGLFIHVDNPYVKGDYVQLNEEEGEVKEITLRSTVLNGHASEDINIPNNKISSNNLKNYTRGIKTKSTINFSLKPEVVDEALEIAENLAIEDEEVLDSPEPSVLYRKYEEGEIISELRYWVRDSADSKRIKSRIIQKFNKEAVKRGLFSENSDEE